ncbi:AAA family ATPase [Pseudomonas sp. GXZC]|uniref:AAA family ATPase n=1 Tax=Pseudomonas sp. GXZC TaxID=3003351 RepID=UPI0022AA2C90|nr:AAA family ATPase [Pseudomonas sp. GXZC]WAT31832.1 AAA family ATPase [Pseudomonas sp. GXZC]
MWEVGFHLTAPAITDPKKVGIFATGTGWNDFGFTLQAVARLRLNGAYKDIPIRLLPFVEDKPQASVQDWIKYLHSVKDGKTEWKPANKVFPTHVTVFATEKSYRELATSMAHQEYEQLLIALNEINAIHKSNKINNDTFKKIIETPQFSVAVLRETAPYRSFRFGYASAFRAPPLEDARLEFSFSTQLEGFKSRHSIDFTYKDMQLISDRVHAVIGVNGIGKTRYLNNLIIAVLQRLNSTYPTEQASELYDNNEKSMPASEFGVHQEDWAALPLYSKIAAYSSDPNNILPRTVSLQGPFDYKYFDIGIESSQKLSQLIVDIMRNDVDLIGSESRFILLKKILTKITPTALLLIPAISTSEDTSHIVDVDGNRWIALKSILGGEMRRLEILSQIDFSRDLAFQTHGGKVIPLSSGQKMYFRFATHFLTVASQGMLVIIDEPETHLHPNLITEFMDLLYLVLEATSSVAIIATHSAYVVREAPAHCVHVIKSDENQTVRTETVYMNTLGASVTSLSNTVFGDSLVESFHSKIATYIAESSLTLDEIIDQYSDTLSMEMLVKIRELMRKKGE